MSSSGQEENLNFMAEMPKDNHEGILAMMEAQNQHSTCNSFPSNSTTVAQFDSATDLCQGSVTRGLNEPNNLGEQSVPGPEYGERPFSKRSNIADYWDIDLSSIQGKGEAQDDEDADDNPNDQSQYFFHYYLNKPMPQADSYERCDAYGGEAGDYLDTPEQAYGNSHDLQSEQPGIGYGENNEGSSHTYHSVSSVSEDVTSSSPCAPSTSKHTSADTTISRFEPPTTGSSSQGIQVVQQEKKHGGEVQRIGDKLVWREGRGHKWIPAVYHHDIWDQLLAMADGVAKEQGGYKIPAQGVEDWNRTAFCEHQKTWSMQRNDRPKVLFRIQKVPVPSPQEPVPFMWFGRRVIDHNDGGMRWFDDLPDTISSAVEGFRLDAMRKMNPNIEWRDIIGRIPIEYKVSGETRKTLTIPALSNRAMRFRRQAGILSWDHQDETGQEITLAFLRNLMGAAIVDSNKTTEFGRDLSKGEVEELIWFLETQRSGWRQNKANWARTKAVTRKFVPPSSQGPATSSSHPNSGKQSLLRKARATYASVSGSRRPQYQQSPTPSSSTNLKSVHGDQVSNRIFRNLEEETDLDSGQVTLNLNGKRGYDAESPEEYHEVIAKRQRSIDPTATFNHQELSRITSTRQRWQLQNAHRKGNRKSLRFPQESDGNSQLRQRKEPDQSARPGILSEGDALAGQQSLGTGSRTSFPSTNVSHPHSSLDTQGQKRRFEAFETYKSRNEEIGYSRLKRRRLNLPSNPQTTECGHRQRFTSSMRPRLSTKTTLSGILPDLSHESMEDGGHRVPVMDGLGKNAGNISVPQAVNDFRQLENTYNTPVGHDAIGSKTDQAGSQVQLDTSGLNVPSRQIPGKTDWQSHESSKFPSPWQGGRDGSADAISRIEGLSADPSVRELNEWLANPQHLTDDFVTENFNINDISPQLTTCFMSLSNAGRVENGHNENWMQQPRFEVDDVQPPMNPRLSSAVWQDYQHSAHSQDQFQNPNVASSAFEASGDPPMTGPTASTALEDAQWQGYRTSTPSPSNIEYFNAASQLGQGDNTFPQHSSGIEFAGFMSDFDEHLKNGGIAEDYQVDGGVPPSDQSTMPQPNPVEDCDPNPDLRLTGLGLDLSWQKAFDSSSALEDGAVTVQHDLN